MSNAADDDIQGLAARWELEYLEPSAVSVEPRALALLPGDECRRLRAVPLATNGGALVVGVAEPSQERFDAVRALTGAETRFVLVATRTLDALLSSRMFAGPRDAEPEQAPPPQQHRIEPEPVEPEPFVPEPVEPEPAPPAADVEAEETRERRAPTGDVAFDELLAQIDASFASWSALRTAVVSLGEGLDDAKRSLRETKEQLSVAHAENDQLQRRAHALETEVAEAQAVVGEARSRLSAAVEALGPRRPQETESSDLL